MAETTIQWTATPGPDGVLRKGFTFNPWIGCEEVSPECDNCYARQGSARLGAQHGLQLWDGDHYQTGEDYWKKPAAWNRACARDGRRAKVFCASFADVFQDVPALVARRARLFQVIDATPWLDWLLLTKRPENIPRLMPATDHPSGVRPNVWLGTTCGVRPSLARVVELAKHRAAVRFVSMEPMLEDVPLGVDVDATSNRFGAMTCPVCRGWGGMLTSFAPDVDGHPQEKACAHCNSTGCAIDWVICGGESGPRARPFDLRWARRLRDECARASVAFFMKQLGARPYVSPEHDGATGFEVNLKDGHGGDPAEWPEDLCVREWPEVA